MKEKVGGLKRDLIYTKVKLDIYNRFGKSVDFKKYMYLHGVCDAGSRLLFKFRSVRMV